jgi:hypothetical protein
MTATGIYIYGVVPNFYSGEMFRSLENSGVYAVPYENISAIVSYREGTEIDYSNREALGYLLVHHQKTIEELHNLGFNILIPMRLGTIVKTKEDIFKIFASGYNLITDTLKKIQFLTEVDLAVTWANFPATVKDVSNDPEVVALRESIMLQGSNLTQEDQMKAGMLVQSKLKEKNSKVELNILDSLSPFSLDIKPHELMNDQMIANSAFLITRSNQEEFEQMIDKLDEEYNGTLNFKLIGPLPCYSFYTIEVEELNLQAVIDANIELGLKEETSESVIKKAYLKKAKKFHPDVTRQNGDEEYFNKLTNAYHTLLDYSAVARQMSNNENDSTQREKMAENLILVKIKK